MSQRRASSTLHALHTQLLEMQKHPMLQHLQDAEIWEYRSQIQHGEMKSLR